AVYNSINTNNGFFQIKWFVIFDTNILKDLDAELLYFLQSNNVILYFEKGINGDFGHQLLNKVIDEIKSGYIYFLDDDNLLHPNLLTEFFNKMEEDKSKNGFLFHQEINGKDFTGLEYRIADINDIKVQKIDMAQFIIDRKLIGENRFE